MATNNDSDEYPPSPANDESDDETEELSSFVKAEATDDEETEAPADPAPAPAPASAATDNVAQLLRQLQSSGALVRRPSAAAVKSEPPDYRCVTCRLRFSDWERLERHLIQHVSLPSLVLDRLPSDEEDSSDEEQAARSPPPAPDLARLLRNAGVSVKRPTASAAASAAAAPALDKLSGLGFTIKKSTPVKEEKPDGPPAGADLLHKLGQLGGLKLKLKSDGASANSFTVVNGLRDFKASDDDDSERDEPPDDDGDEPEAPLLASRLAAKPEPSKADAVPARPARPNIKQTPKRADGAPQRRGQVQIKEIVVAAPSPAPAPAPQTPTMERVVVKQEAEDSGAQGTTVPLFSGHIKTERASPPAQGVAAPLPAITRVKTETEAADCGAQAQPLFASRPLLPVTKTEDTVIEINGDSNDEDDDCCVVSATPAPDVKPVVVVPKIEPVAYPAASAGGLGAFTPAASDYYWGRADSKMSSDAMEKSADDLFESLLSSAKKDNHLSLADASEYISLDRLGPQHACEVCNTRFTSLAMLDEHVRGTGHSRTVLAPSSALMPYGSGALMSSLLPVKQLAEQVGKLSTLGAPGSAAFTHQQNVMINIQAYPGAAGMMGAAPAYSAYGAPQPSYPGGMYGMQGQGYQPQQPYGQPAYQPPMSKAGYGAGYAAGPGASYSAASPLQGMQQAVYAQAPGPMNPPQSPVGAMGPPGQLPPRCSPGSLLKPMASPSGVRIQNVQTFAPGQASHMQPPAPVRVAGPTPISLRPKLAPTNIRPRPTIRPGAQLQGQGVRGGKAGGGGGPRMALKRPAGVGGAAGAGGPPKRRPDMLLPGKHDNEDCHVMAMQRQREGLPLIQSVQGAKDKLRLGGQLTITKKKVNREATAMADVLAQRGIMVKAKQRSRSPSPERPLPHLPNLGAGVSIKHSSRPASFSIPEARVGGGMLACRVCRKMFSNSNSLAVHMGAAHGQAPGGSGKVAQFRCDECPAAYPKSLQLQHHKRVFHNVSGPNRELGLPVVDLSQEANLKRLGALGIYSFIPLANREQASGCFGIPVLSVHGHGAHNGVTNSLQALGADGLLSLGPLKPLPNT